MKVPVTEKALLARVNRQLSKENRKLVKSPKRVRGDDSEYMCICLSNNTIDSQGVFLDDWAREIGALKEWEEMK
jgi:hypothetical protein